MGFMDKAKGAATKAKVSAEHVARQGQAKVTSVQQSRNEAKLYRSLGEAYYHAERRGGDRGAVAAALTALDEHFAAASSPAQAAATQSAAGDAPGPAAPLPTEAVAPPPAGPAPTAPPVAAPPTGDLTPNDR